MDLGTRQEEGVLSTANKILSGGWLVVFNLLDMPREAYEIYHGHIAGPGGYAVVYLDDYPEDIIQNGRVSAFDPNIATYVRPGQTVSVHWSTAAGTTPKVTLKLRTPEVGRL